MNPDSERKVAIFIEALKVPVHEREALLRRRCDGDEDLFRNVEALLKAHARLGNFLEEPPASHPFGRQPDEDKERAQTGFHGPPGMFVRGLSVPTF